MAHANTKLDGNQKTTATVASVINSLDEQPLKMGGSAFKCSGKLVLDTALTNDTGRFGEQKACKDEHHGTHDAEHTHLGPLGFALACFVEFGEC